MSVVRTKRLRALDCDEHRCDGCGAVLFVVFPQLALEAAERYQVARGCRTTATHRRAGALRLPDGQEIEVHDHALVCVDTFEACAAQVLARGDW